MEKNCLNCSSLFKKSPSDSLAYWGRKKYCSSRCFGLHAKTYLKLIGRKRPKAVISLMRKTMFRSGVVPWNKRKKIPALTGDRHPAWKGDSAGYGALHAWISSRLGRACKCENTECRYPRKSSNGKILKYPRAFNWANISHSYRRDLNDWKQLCISCHQLYDCGKIKL